MNNDINEKIVHAAPVPPFVRFVASAVPMVFDNSLSYYEALCALWKWIQDDVINVINNNATVTEHYIELDEETRQLFIELKSYVDNYFDNLDVQEEINNKLDAMVEAGTLQEIITTYIQSNVTWTFDTVADMKLATNLVNGSYARTLGFYSVNDGGGATYYITNTGTANEMDVIAVGSLYANLQHQDSVYIKQLGAKGDGETDDTDIIDYAFTIVNNVIMNTSVTPYLAKYLKVTEGKSIKGESLPYVQINLSRDGSTVISRAYSNTSIENIYLNSLDENLSNNRFDVRDSNIVIKNCRFEGFRASNNNAWGILITGASNVNIDNCYFKSNTQSDIAVVEGTKNVVINKCYGDSFHINFEPQNDTRIINVKITQSEIAKLDLRENTYNDSACNDITIEECVIDLLEYDGAKATFIDCIIKDIQQQGGAGASGFGGEVKFINSLNMGKSLIKDIHIDTFQPSTSGTREWFTQSFPSGVSSSMTLAYENDVPLFTLNQNHTSQQVVIRHQNINVDPSKIYMIRYNAAADYSQGGTNISQNTVIRFFSADDTQISEIAPSMFRGRSGNKVPLHEECWFFKVPSNASYIKLLIRNSSYGKQSFSIASVELFEVGSSELNAHEIASPKIRNRRVFISSDVATTLNYSVGDTMYYETPSTYIGKVCTSVTDYTATWKDFGAISS